MISDWSAFDPLSVLGQDPQQLADDMSAHFAANVIGNTHLVNSFMPLILKGSVKKVLVLTSGMADNDLVVQYGVYEGGPYSISKAALNMVTSKFQAEYQKNGVLFIGISPGVVETGQYNDSMYSLLVSRFHRENCIDRFPSVRRESSKVHDPGLQIRSLCARFQSGGVTSGFSQGCLGSPGEVELG